VNWNQNTPLVQRAKGAVLAIQDGDSPPVELRLDPEQLREGNLLYTPRSRTVRFSLGVVARNNQTKTETVLALASLPVDPARPKPPAKPQLARVQAGDPSKKGQLSSGHDIKPAVRSGPRAALQETVPRLKPPDSKTAVTSHAAETSGRAAGVYIAPHAILESRPHLSAGIRATIASEAELRVKVEIDALGQVVQAGMVSSQGPASPALVRLTEETARLWKFAPAVRGGEPVASEAVLVFRFRPTE
jgi:outer membrane biosynthesis protein TonB